MSVDAIDAFTAWLNEDDEATTSDSSTLLFSLVSLAMEVSTPFLVKRTNGVLTVAGRRIVFTPPSKFSFFRSFVFNGVDWASIKRWLGVGAVKLDVREDDRVGR